MKNDLLTVYSYFSHNFRTCTSTIVATIEALKMELIDVNSDEMKSIYESSFIMDILDVCLNICIDHILNLNSKASDYDLNITNLIKKFVEEQKQLIELSELEVEIPEEDFIVNKNSYIIKNLLQIILFEGTKNATHKLKIKIDGKTIFIQLKDSKDNPNDIFGIFKNIFKQNGVNFEYNKDEYILEF
ncbi:MAG: hypothetical protein LDL13_05830 [Calditerrivibrio sp.]|nr:hypothetical protein [Calditerrivibrio sp.]MCA1933077.1 hypothetical protein [Calditerrivibrio sp.]MCA1980251.1 hypothetical protein [Calditerrivibrio sp.]